MDQCTMSDIIVFFQSIGIVYLEPEAEQTHRKKREPESCIVVLDNIHLWSLARLVYSALYLLIHQYLLTIHVVHWSTIFVLHMAS